MDGITPHEWNEVPDDVFVAARQQAALLGAPLDLIVPDDDALHITIRDDATGHLIAYRFTPVTRSRDAWYHVLHDALALRRRTPTHLMFEQCLPIPFVQALQRLHNAYQLNQPVTPYWQEWSNEQRATIWSAKQVYRLFGRYVECQQGYDPFRQLLNTAMSLTPSLPIPRGRILIFVPV